MPPLPIAIISPHGGLAVPPEVTSRVALSETQIFNEADAFTDDLYNFEDRVLCMERFPYARAIIDVNRPLTNTVLGRVGDGAIKARTSYGVPVYYRGQEPDDALKQTLIRRYWQPWQNKLAQLAQDPRVELVIDVHSMAAVGPRGYEDAGLARPRAQVGNYGDLAGNALPGQPPISATADQADFLRGQLAERLATLEPLANVGQAATLNWPYIGGYQLATYGGGPQPWLMVEINRALYIGEQTSDSPATPPDAPRIAAIRDQLWAAIEALYHRYISRARPTG